MYFFLQRTACFTQWWRGRNIYVTLCISVLKSTDIMYIWGKWQIANHAPMGFSGRWGPSSPACFVPTSMLCLHAFWVRLGMTLDMHKKARHRSGIYPPSSGWNRMLLISQQIRPALLLKLKISGLHNFI